MITTIKQFKEYLTEQIEDPRNSDKSIQLKEYEDDIEYYNSNKDKFKQILSGKPEEQWEEEANKIIDKNSYLGLHWRLEKLNKGLFKNEETLKGELSQEERNELIKQIDINRKEINELQQDIKKRITNDLATVKEL